MKTESKGRSASFFDAGLLLGALFVWIFYLRRILAPQYSFAGKVAVITGGSRGLGLALARRLGREGARLVLIARNHKVLARARADLLHRGYIVAAWPCDVRDQSAVESTLKEIGRKFGAIDILINNAGEMVVGPVESMTTADFDQALKIHFWAPLNVTLAALPYFRKNAETRIANISSIGGLIAVPHLAPYCVSKFALTALSDALGAELVRHRIFVTTVTPGLMRTGSHKSAFFKGDTKREFAWFSVGAGNPLLSMGADRAARQILNSIRRRKARLIITLSARTAVIAYGLFPNLVARMIKLFGRLLPQKPPGAQTKSRSGWQSRSRFSPSLLTYLADRASYKLNQIPDEII